MVATSEEAAELARNAYMSFVRYVHVHMYVCVRVCVCICTYISLEDMVATFEEAAKLARKAYLSFIRYVYILSCFIYIYIYVCMYVYIQSYLHTKCRGYGSCCRAGMQLIHVIYWVC